MENRLINEEFMLAWQMALMHPERIERVISLNTPFMPRVRTRPLETIGREPDDRFNYVAYFQWERMNDHPRI